MGVKEDIKRGEAGGGGRGEKEEKSTAREGGKGCLSHGHLAMENPPGETILPGTSGATGPHSTGRGQLYSDGGV